MEKTTNFRISKCTMICMCIICALILIISVIIAEGISSRYENTYSIETSKLHLYQIGDDTHLYKQ